MIRVVIIDDEQENIKLLSNLISLYAPQLIVAGSADSVASAHLLILKEKPRLVFLDVELGDGTGFDLLRKLQKPDFSIIFTTAHLNYAIEAFHFAALDYILKPIAPAKFLAAVQRAEEVVKKEELIAKTEALLNNLQESNKRFRKIIFKTLDRVYAVGSNEISRLESEGNYTTVYLHDGKKITVSRLLKDYDLLLSEYGFVRVHQSHLVNLDFILYFQKDDSVLIMKDNSTVPVSSRKKEHLLALLQAG